MEGDCLSKIFFKNYINNLISLLQTIDIKKIEEIVDKLQNSKNNTIYLIGNGGSAATASHMANDLGVGLKRRGCLNLNVISLCDNASINLALANDIGFENIFYMQLKDTIKKDDVLIAISCSGNSLNIVKAVHYAKEKEATVIGVTGFDGGELKKICDINFHVPTKKGEYGLTEDIHMILDHIIFSYFLQKDNIG